MRLLPATTLSCLSAMFLSLAASAGDIITLKNGDTLTGELTDSDQAGVYFLNYPDSTKPLKIKEEFISTVSFANDEAKPGNNSEKILLENGDHFPCKLESFDENNVTFTSDYMGKHTVPRNMVHRIYFNNKAQNVIYEGPGDDLGAWTTTSKDWKVVKDGGFTTDKKTQIAKTIAKLPENFLLEFTAAWTGEAPRLKVYFCAESTNIAKKLDNYYLDMSSLEFRITHYVKRRYKNLGFHNVDPKIYTVPKGKVSLYVDRKNKKMVLYYNSKKIQEFKDVATPPKGSGLVFHTLQRTGEKVTISDIKISTWNGDLIEESDKNEDRLKSNDIVTDTSGNPMTGKLAGITKKAGKFFVDFNIAFAKKPSSIPMDKIHHIDLQRPKDVKEAADTTRTLTLIQGGVLSYNSSQIVEDKLVLTHPIIGEIKVNKSTINRLEIKEIK